MREPILTIPNLIVLLRLILVPIAFRNFLADNNQYYFLAFTVLIIILDGLDGIAARRLNQATVWGAKFDIWGDRITELAYWYFFAYLGILHIWVFYFFLARGLLVDYLTFKQDRPLGDSFLRSSRIMRASYGTLKVLSFCSLIILPHQPITYIFVYLTTLLCFLRAYPVLKQKF